MKKHFSKFTAAILCIAVLLCTFAACSDEDKSNPVDTSSELKELEWVIKPSIKADGITPLVRADFNSSTNHYDISYAEYFRIEKGGKYGIIDFNGKTVTEAEFDELFTIGNSDDYLGINGKDSDRIQTYIHNGSFETERAYKTYNSVKYEYYWDESEKAVFVEASGDEITEHALSATLPEPIAGVKKSGNGYKRTGEYGLLVGSANLTGQIYTGAGCFSDGLAAFCSNGKWGYIDSTGRTVLPFDFDAVSGYSALGGSDTPYESSDGYLTVCKGGKFAFYTNKGDKLSEFDYDYATPVVNGKAFALVGDKWGVVLVDGDYSGAQTAKKSETSSDNSSEGSTENSSSDKSGTYMINVDEGERVNLRSEASTDGEIIDSIEDGVEVYVDKVYNGWGHTAYDGNEGWINLEYAERQ